MTVQWTDVMWNPTPPYYSLTDWTGRRSEEADNVDLNKHMIDQPLHWKKPRRIAVKSMSDLFHESMSDLAIDCVFAIMAQAPQHTFQVLTKCADRMQRYMTALYEGKSRVVESAGILNITLGALAFDRRVTAAKIKAGPLPNVWLGVSVEDQETFNARVWPLLETPAAIRFVSCEPLRGVIVMGCIGGGLSEIYPLEVTTGCLNDDGSDAPDLRPIDWVIAGGESGADAEPMHPTWVRYLRAQCTFSGVPFFFKQWGRWAPCDRYHPRGQVMRIDDSPFAESGSVYMAPVGTRAAGRLLEGVEHNAFPSPSDG